jgi:hypothetical protein
MLKSGTPDLKSSGDFAEPPHSWRHALDFDATHGTGALPSNRDGGEADFAFD